MSTFGPTDGFSSTCAGRTPKACSRMCGTGWPAGCWRLRSHFLTGCGSYSSRATARRSCSAHTSRTTSANCAPPIPARPSKNCSGRPAGMSHRRTSPRTVRARQSISPSQPKTAPRSTWEPGSTRTRRSPMVRVSRTPTRSARRHASTGICSGGRWRRPGSSTIRPSGGTGPTVTATGHWPPARPRRATARSIDQAAVG